MDTFDLNKLKSTISILDRIADGINPLDDCSMPEDSVLNDPAIIRSMFFAKEVLEAVKRNDGVVGGKGKGHNKAEFPIEALKNFEYQLDLPITKFVEQLNSNIDHEVFQKLSYKVIRNWLIANSFLEEKYVEKYKKNCILPTAKGETIGIISEDRISTRGADYVAIIYTRPAQEFIVKNMEIIINGEVI